MTDDLDAFIARYFDDCRMASGGGTRQERVVRERRATETAYLDKLVRHDPEAAWPKILALVERAPDRAALAFVAAGPLEALITQHGGAFVDRIAAEARRSADFRLALGDVWGWGSIPVEVRDRLIPLLPGPPVA